MTDLRQRKRVVSLAGINGERAEAIVDVLVRHGQAMTALDISQSIYLDRECFRVSSPYETVQSVLRAMLADDQVWRAWSPGGWLYDLHVYEVRS